MESGPDTADIGARPLPQELSRKADSLTLPARPESFPLSPSEMPLIVVDMQNA